MLFERTNLTVVILKGLLKYKKDDILYNRDVNNTEDK